MTIKRIKIDSQRCTGCGSCVVLAPDAFVFNVGGGEVEVREGWEKVSPEDLRRARNSCPAQAIVLEEM